MKIISYYKSGIIFILKFPFIFLKFLIIGLINILSIIPRSLIIGFKYIFEKKKDNYIDILDNKFINIVIATLSVVTYLLCIFILSRWYVQNERTKRFAESLLNDPIANQENIENQTNQYNDKTDSLQNNNTKYSNNINISFLNVNLDYYIQRNKETVAWIQVNGTNINYPVVQHKDNAYYLSHDFYDHKTNVGWIFADYRDNFDYFNNNTIIYGHNLINRTMFGQIPYMLRKNWFSTSSKEYIKLSTQTSNTIWQIFSVYETPPTTDYLQSIFNSTTTYQQFLDKIKNKSQQKFTTEVDNTDKIITLSTCNDIGNKRVAVHAKLVKIENK